MRVTTEAHQGAPHLVDGFFRVVQRNVQVTQHHLQRRLAVELGDDIVFTGCDAVIARDRLTTLGDTRHQAQTAGAFAQRAVNGSPGKGHTAQPAAEDPAGGPLTFEIAMAAERKLQRTRAAGGQATKYVTAVGAGGHFFNELRHIGRAGVCMHQRCVRIEAAGRRQGRNSGKNAVLRSGHLAQHDGHGRLVKVLHIV